MKKIVVLIIVLFVHNLYANIGIVRTPSSTVGNIIIADENSLKVVKETLVCDIQPKGLVNQVIVTYLVKNTGSQAFNGNVYFISSFLKEEKFSLKINGVAHPFKKIMDKNVLTQYKALFFKQAHAFDRNARIKQRYREHAVEGKLFSLAIAPLETKTVTIRFQQFKGYDMSKGGPTYASSSHMLNVFRNKLSGHYASYHYFLFPINSFKAGVDELYIKVKHPTKTRYPDESVKARVGEFSSNVPLKQTTSGSEYSIYEGTFAKVPADIWSFGLNMSLYSRWGFTLVPYYYFNFTEERRDFAFSAAVDYIIKHEQVSLGAFYSLDKQLQFFQEIKFFPKAHPYYLAGCFDVRFAVGLVEQVRPDFNFGFKVSGGLRLLLPVEVAYQFFPPLVKDKWEHTLLLSVPLSF